MSIKIAVCDDDAFDSAEMISMLKEHPLIDAEISTYESAVDLLHSYSKGARYDLIFMDIQMEQIDGYTAATQLQERYRDEFPLIVFVTVTDKYVFTGYDVGAFGYFSKPVDKERLFKKIDKAYDELARGAITIRSGSGSIIIQEKDILLVEADNNTLIIKTVSGEHTARMTITELMETLSKRLFIQIHRCYIVNLAHVQRYDDRYVYFDMPYKANISRQKKKGFIKALKEYLRS